MFWFIIAFRLIKTSPGSKEVGNRLLISIWPTHEPVCVHTRSRSPRLAVWLTWGKSKPALTCAAMRQRKAAKLLKFLGVGVGVREWGVESIVPLGRTLCPVSHNVTQCCVMRPKPLPRNWVNSDWTSPLPAAAHSWKAAAAPELQRWAAADRRKYLAVFTLTVGLKHCWNITARNQLPADSQHKTGWQLIESQLEPDHSHYFKWGKKGC